MRGVYDASPLLIERRLQAIIAWILGKIKHIVGS
jgi:hypothetical protein